jgi:hypothetical protein
MRNAVMLACLLSILSLGSARADLLVNWPNGESTYVTPEPLLVGVIAFVCLVFLYAVLPSSSGGDSSSDESLTSIEQVQQYDDEAAQYRALSRKLDAEAGLADSLIKAKRARAELDDVEQFLRDDKRRRRR